VDDVPVWVLDTNVLVSGLLSPFAPPGRLVDVLLGRRLRLALDDRIEIEYREVMARPRLGIEPVRREAFLAILQFQEHLTAMPWPHRGPPDKDDIIFLEVACLTLLKLKNRGAQRVEVQYQQVIVGPGGQALVAGRVGRGVLRDRVAGQSPGDTS
jgi:hypothetical protein